MKVVRINVDGTMDDIDLKIFNKKNIIGKLNKFSNSKGETDLKELYKWSIDSNIELQCYGRYDGSNGFENKHDLPPNGISDFLDDEYDSSTKLLFGDIFICIFNNKNKKFENCVVSDYGRYYEELFEGFDDCNTSDDDIEGEEEELPNTDDEDFIVDDKEEILNDEDEDESDFNSDEQLDIDSNEYTSDENDYDDACEGETDDEEQ